MPLVAPLQLVSNTQSVIVAAPLLQIAPPLPLPAPTRSIAELLTKVQPSMTGDPVPHSIAPPPPHALLSTKKILIREGEEPSWQRTPPPFASPQQSSVEPPLIVISLTIESLPSAD